MHDSPSSPSQADELGLDLPPGARHYRAYVGPPGDYDLVAAMTFGLLNVLGLREQHRVLDVGCGSLRVGRLLIPYLNRGGYTGIEPNAWLVADGIAREVGQSQVDAKQPRFIFSDTAGVLCTEPMRFDYALAQSIFSHCGPDLLGAWLEQVSTLLADDGALVATYLPAATDNDRPGWIYPDCVYYTPSTLKSLARSHGLRFLDLDWRHPRQQWALFAKPGFDVSWIEGKPLSWNMAFEHFNGLRT